MTHVLLTDCSRITHGSLTDFSQIRGILTDCSRSTDGWNTGCTCVVRVHTRRASVRSRSAPPQKKRFRSESCSSKSLVDLVRAAGFRNPARPGARSTGRGRGSEPQTDLVHAAPGVAWFRSRAPARLTAHAAPGVAGVRKKGQALCTHHRAGTLARKLGMARVAVRLPLPRPVMHEPGLAGVALQLPRHIFLLGLGFNFSE